MKKFTTPAKSKRLFDLVTSKEEKYLNAFYYAMKDTLVVSDINLASKVTIGKDSNYRVVTEAGEVIEISGQMSGGGRMKKGLMSHKIVEEFTDS